MSREREDAALENLEAVAREAVRSWAPAPYTTGHGVHRRLVDALEVLDKARKIPDPEMDHDETDSPEPDWLANAGALGRAMRPQED